MSSDDFAIRVRGVSKCYQIYDKPQDRLRQAVLPRLKRWFGQDAGEVRYFREFWALRDVSFDVKRGGTVGIVGKNGSGKSTLLQIICGTMAPTAGEVEVRGRVAALLELGAGFNPEFTGRENVFMNASILGLSRQETESRFDEIAAFADIGDFIEQPVKTYSSGMVVRLAFAVIAHVDADVLVIDEALSVGDAFFSQKCMRYLRRFMQTGTVLFVSHDTGAVVSLCDTAVWLENGVKRLESSARMVSDRYLEALVEDRQGKGTFGSVNAEGSQIALPSAADSGRVSAPRQETAAPSASVPLGVHATPGGDAHAPVTDARWEMLRNSKYRNDIEIFEFDPSGESFGIGQGRIVDVELQAADHRRISFVTGGETVILRIRAEALQPLASPILGFYVRDRLGQVLFGDNTFLSTQHAPCAMEAGRQFLARFEFQMPILPMGDYSITAALAEGTQQDHVQHHWIHDALIFRSHSSSVHHGLVGIPMRSVSLAPTSHATSLP
jgi:lipopolysaccharide transport system ATP-binding protein